MVFFCACVGFGMTLPHRKAAVFTARRLELLKVVSTMLSFLHPDSQVHSFLSPLPHQVRISIVSYYENVTQMPDIMLEL